MTETTTAVTKTRETSVLMRMAERFQMDPKAFEAVIRKTVMPGDVSNEHLAAFLLVADQYKLNPLTKQIHAFVGRGGGVVPIVGVDGWHYLANEHPQYDGMAQRNVKDEDLGIGIETTIYRKDRSHPTVHTAWLNECQRPTEPWKMKMRMLGHKSFIQAARMAFSLSGIYDEDEAERFVETTAVPAGPKLSRTKQLEAALTTTSTKLGEKPTSTIGIDLGDDSYNNVLEQVFAEGAEADESATCPHPAGSDAEGAWLAGRQSRTF